MSIKLPTASTTKDGILTNASQTVAGDKTFNMSAQTTFTSTGTARLRLNSGGTSNQAIVELNAVDTGDFPSLQFFQAGTMRGIVRGHSSAPFQVLNASSTIIAAADTAGAWTLGASGGAVDHKINGNFSGTMNSLPFGSFGAPAGGSISFAIDKVLTINNTNNNSAMLLLLQSGGGQSGLFFVSNNAAGVTEITDTSGAFFVGTGAEPGGVGWRVWRVSTNGATFIKNATGGAGSLSITALGGLVSSISGPA